MATSRRGFDRFAPVAAAALLLAGCGGSSPAGIETTPPAVPAGLSAEPGDQVVTLTWMANAESDLLGYDVYQGTTSGALTKVASVTAPATTHIASGLSNGSTYYFAVTASDKNGNASDKSSEVSASPFPPDRIPPTASLSVPAAGATGVAVGTVITVVFSEDMAPATVTASLVPPPLAPAELGQPAWTDGKTLTFQPSGDLAFNTAYTLTVEGKDLAGNDLTGTKSFGFTTANPPDVTPPTIAGTGPADGVTGVGVGTGLTFQFSEPMNAASVQGAFTASPAVSCTWNPSPDGTTFTCNHVDLAFATTYKVNIGAGATDLAGNHFVPPTSPAVVLTFTTANIPDTTPPQVCPATGGASPCPATSATSPAPGVTGVARAANIVARFSEPMDQASAQAAFAITAPAGHTAGVFTWNAAGDEMTFNPEVDFAYGDYVTWRVAIGAKDLANNFLAAQFTSTFRVIRQSTTSFYSTASLDGFVINTASGSSGVYTGYSYGAAGDSSLNAYWRAFLSFDLSALPTTFTLTSATLNVYQANVYGAPYTGLGGTLKAESVNYGTSLDAADFETPVLQTLQCVLVCTAPPFSLCRCRDLTLQPEVVNLSSTADVGWKSVLVTRKVNDDLSAANRTSRGSRSQFRLRFPTNTNSNSALDDSLILTGEAANNTASGDNRARLDLIYEYP